MSWLAYALATVILWTAWRFLGVIALKDVGAAHATLVFGIAVVAVGVASLVLGGRGGSWSPSGLTVAAISGGCGALGMAAFLSESLSAVQAIGVALAVTGMVLVGTGG